MCKITNTNSQYRISKFALTVHHVNALRFVLTVGCSRVWWYTSCRFLLLSCGGKAFATLQQFNCIKCGLTQQRFQLHPPQIPPNRPLHKKSHTHTHTPNLLLSQHGAKRRRCSICMQTSRLILQNQMIPTLMMCRSGWFCPQGFKERFAYCLQQGTLHWMEY